MELSSRENKKTIKPEILGDWRKRVLTQDNSECWLKLEVSKREILSEKRV